jgi:hypothetical protein
MKEYEYVKFRDLSIWLKLAILGGWYSFATFVVYFAIGLLSSL